MILLIATFFATKFSLWTTQCAANMLGLSSCSLCVNKWNTFISNNQFDCGQVPFHFAFPPKLFHDVFILHAPPGVGVGTTCGTKVSKNAVAPWCHGANAKFGTGAIQNMAKFENVWHRCHLKNWHQHRCHLENWHRCQFGKGVAPVPFKTWHRCQSLKMFGTGDIWKIGTNTGAI